MDCTPSSLYYHPPSVATFQGWIAPPAASIITHLLQHLGEGSSFVELRVVAMGHTPHDPVAGQRRVGQRRLPRHDRRNVVGAADDELVLEVGRLFWHPGHCSKMSTVQDKNIVAGNDN